MILFYISILKLMLEEFSAFLAEYNVVGMAVGLLVAVKVGDLV